MHTVYIIYSKTKNKYYTGVTKECILNRIWKHYSKNYNGYHFTHQADDWVVYLLITCKTATSARSIETHIKKMKSRKYIQNLKGYPELRNKLLIRYS